LNKGYTDTGITWVLGLVTRTQNSDWFNKVAPDEPEQTDMKTFLRTGGVTDLNVYTVGYDQKNNGNKHPLIVFLVLRLDPVLVFLAIQRFQQTIPATLKTTAL
jgi:hypothetical protein